MALSNSGNQSGTKAKLYIAMGQIKYSVCSCHLNFTLQKIQIIKDYKMDIKVTCLIILLTINNANSKPLPSKTIEEQVKQFSEKLHNLEVPKWGCSKACQKRRKMFQRLHETQNVKTLLELTTKNPFKLSKSTLHK